MPDVLEPRRYDSHHDRSEAYWTERNALVDVIRAIGDAAPSCVTDVTAFNEWLRGPQGVAYGAAMNALKDFDAAHGGTPIL